MNSVNLVMLLVLIIGADGERSARHHGASDMGW